MLSENDLMVFVAQNFNEYLDDFINAIDGIYRDMLNALPVQMDDFDKLTILTTTIVQFYSLHIARIITPLCIEKRALTLQKFSNNVLEQAKELQIDFIKLIKEARDGESKSRE